MKKVIPLDKKNIALNGLKNHKNTSSLGSTLAKSLCTTSIHTPRDKIFLTTNNTRKTKSMISPLVTGASPKKYMIKSLEKNQKRRLIFNKVYGLPTNFDEKYKEFKKRKNANVSLEKYQNDLLDFATQIPMPKSHFMDFQQCLKQIKLETENIKPLPPINLNIIYNHTFFPKKKIVQDKKLTLKQILNKKNVEKDDYEKEQELIKQLKRFRPVRKLYRNKGLDMLPPYLNEIFGHANKSKIKSFEQCET